MASSITTLEEMSEKNRIDQVLSRIMHGASVRTTPSNGGDDKDSPAERSEDLQRHRIILAELILLWLANQLPDCHPILKLLQNDNAKS
jgi:hypothetical protein